MPTTHLFTRQNLSSSSRSSLHDGLHPAAIFGIVAGVMLLVIITIWCGMFRVWKRMMTNREYGVLPTMRIAANGQQPTNTPYGAQPTTLNSPYGPQPNYASYGLQPTSSPYDPQTPSNTYGGQPMNTPYAPYGNGPYTGQAPPPYSGGPAAGLTTLPPAASHSRSPSTASMNKALPPVNKSLPSLQDPEGGSSSQRQ
ncbi:hypothetical protein B0T16DRAFT_391232 [Cercophora newfieldiana]|uniref:Uncharacterized protein n=1 Tax=Cercophora newfieldiana TaxID=92897 RepID=A0AA39Y8J2_9PEZI|nr:hypothetical protein B0T16DRAFT_391232 [Cercophora newfieldiana]